jgi:deoxyribose-phosphate aldolase
VKSSLLPSQQKSQPTSRGNGHIHAARPAIDQVMADERATPFAKRSIKTSAKLDGLKLATSMMNLTTLEGKDTLGKIAFLCRKAIQPLDSRYNVPSCGPFVFI